MRVSVTTKTQCDSFPRIKRYLYQVVRGPESYISLLPYKLLAHLTPVYKPDIVLAKLERTVEPETSAKEELEEGKTSRNPPLDDLD